MDDNQIYKSAESLNAALSTLPENVFTVAFFISNTNVYQDEWLNPLADYLGRNGFATIGIKTPESENKCCLDSAQFQAVIEREEISRLSGIKVFIISDMDCGLFPQESRVLGCTHGFGTAKDTALPSRTIYGSLLDAHMVSFPLDEKSREKIPSLWNGMLNIKEATRKNPVFHIIPQGYPRMHILAREIKEQRRKPDSVVYAPVGIDYNMDMGGKRFNRHGKRIIRTLLSNFPDLNVIFRPYRIDIDKDEVKDVCAAFADEKRFILDSQPGRAESFSRGLALVTDLSHIAQSFAFTTLRGAIYFQPWVTTEAKSNEWSGGVTAYNYTTLIDSIKNMLEYSEEWTQKIRKNRDQLVAPFENSFAEIADWLKDFYQGKTRPGWLAIKRCNPEEIQSVPETINKIMRQPEFSRTLLAATAAIYTHSMNPLIFAFALHLGKIMQPNSFPSAYSRMEDGYKTLLNKSLIGLKYKDIDPEDIRRLYSMGMLKMLKENNSEGIQIAETLAENFENLYKNQPASSSKKALADGNTQKTTLLTESGLKELLARLSGNKLVVGLYIGNLYAQQDEWLNALAAKLNERGYITIGIIAPQNSSRCNLQNAQYNVELSRDKLRNLGRINVFIASDIDYWTVFPEKSKILACVHSFVCPDDRPFNMSGAIHHAALVDGWMLPMKIDEQSREAIHKLWDGFVNHEFSRRKSEQFNIIPVGYPRLASMLPYIQSNETTQNSIVYAPVAIDYDLEHGGKRVANHGIRIIETLLANFTDLDVIFRPSMQDMEKPETREILAVFGDEKRFVFDSHPDQIFAFSRGCALITDLSNIAKSFAFLCRRPGIYFSPWQASPTAWSRWAGGFNAYSYEGLLDTVRMALENPREEAEIIERNREKELMPFESAFDEIAEWLPDFYNDMPRKDWVTIERGPTVKPVGENELVKKIGEKPPYCNDAYAAAVFNNPHSHLLAALAVHYGIKECPSAYLITGLPEVLNGLLGSELPILRYSQIKPFLVKQLYQKALAEKLENNDFEGCELVENLMREFDVLCSERKSAEE